MQTALRAAADAERQAKLGKVSGMIEIVVDAASLDRSPSGSITGRICITNQVGAFPDKEWSDFPVVAPSWWINGLRDLAAGRTLSFDEEFMGGDFSFVGESGVVSWKEGAREESVRGIWK